MILHYSPKKNDVILVVCLIVFFVCAIAFTWPNNHFRVGSLFFGGQPKLYNIEMADFFYTYAAYPLYGTAPEFAHYQLSRVHFIKGNFPMALSEAEHELTLYPNNKRTYYILGLTYGYMNREEEAIAAFSQFIAAYPDSWAARNDKAWLQFRIGDVEGALATILPVKDLRNPWVQNTYGTLLLNNREKDAAKEALLLAKEITDGMNVTEWGVAYPGNDPRIYQSGLDAMRVSIAKNLSILEQ
jgi:tetratricopeptide (TPR) repeat protein